MEIEYTSLDEIEVGEEEGKYNFGIFFSELTPFYQLASTSDQLNFTPSNFHRIGLQTPQNIHKSFLPYWEKQKAKTNPSLTQALVHFSRPSIIRSVVYAILTELLFLSSVLLLPYFVEYFFDEKVPFWYGIVYAGIIMLSTALAYVTSIQSASYAIVTARQVSCAVFGVFYDKVMKSPPGKLNSGELAPILVTFCDELLKNMTKICFTLVSFPKFLICMIVLGLYLHVYVISTIMLLLLGLVLVFLFVYIADRSTKEQEILRRLSGALESEIFSKIKTIKLLHWEEYFKARLSPLNYKKFESHVHHFKLPSHMIYFIGSDVVLLSEAILFISAFQNLSAVVILTVFGILVHVYVSYRFLLVPPWLIMLLKGYVDQIQTFLLGEEVGERESKLDPGHVIFDNVSLSWKEKTVLSDVSMELQPGHFMILIGGVGSGKSTFLQSLISPQSISAGKVVTGGRIGLVSQPWIPHGTIRENIALNNKLLNENFYWQVINAVDLEEDLKRLPDGDMTMITMGGEVLSGGQQQRIAVARALYSDCDIYVLDDCLSAVDGNVAKHIFQKGIIDILRKRKKTIIMATNQLEYLPQANSIAIIADGKIMEWDSYSNLLEREHFHSFLKEHYPDFQKKLISKETSLEDEFEQTTLNKGNDFLEFQPEQSKFEGEIGWNKYWEVISAGKSQYFILAVFLNMCRPLIRFFSFWWLISLWLPLSNSEITSSIPLSYCLTVFLASYLLQILLNLLHHYFLLLNIKNGVHYYNRKIFSAFLNAPISFFATTRIGTILEVLSRDFVILVNWVQDSLTNVEDFTTMIIGPFLCVCFALPIFIPILVIVLAIFIPFQKRACMAIIRIERILKSSKPMLFNHLKESIEGIQYITAYQLQQDMYHKGYKVMDAYATAFFLKESLFTWFTSRVYGFGLLITTSIFICGLIARNISFLPSESILIALGTMTGLSNIYYFAPYSLLLGELACAMVYTEPFQHFIGIESEKHLLGEQTESESPLSRKQTVSSNIPLQKEDSMQVPLDSPRLLDQSTGKGWSIKFEDVCMKYGNQETHVLNGISFDISPGQKIAIVGRTGSGKSTILSLIMKLYPITGGKIFVDGKDLSRCTISQIRSSIAIIPQMPVIFRNTIRNNVDPYKLYTDKEIVDTLQLVHLEKFAGNLNAIISDTGLSIGEKQLLCFARALLKKSPLLLLDEPTASLDIDTAHLMRDLIYKCFNHCTIIFVAHHLSLVMNFHKIMVMDKGSLVEFGAPSVLLQQKGIFYSMVQSTGELTSLKLVKLVSY